MIPRKHKLFVISILLILSDVNCVEKNSLTFVIDDTSSMKDDIAQVKEGTNAIFDTVMSFNQSQIEDFVLVTFNDPYTILRTITKDRNEFKTALAGIYVKGGGECPEYSMSGIITGIENSRPGSTIYVFTDASAEDHHLYEKARNMAIRKQIQVVFVLTGTCGSKTTPDYLVYQNLAYDTLGEIFHLGKQDVFDILEYVKENLKGRRTILASKKFPSGSHSLNVTDDGGTKHMMVSLTGDNPELEVTKPDGDKADFGTVVKKPNINIIKVLDPKPPGVYNVKVKSDSDSHVLVSAITEINFKQGFSPYKPSSIEETTTTPLPDVKSHITIKLTDGNIELKTVQILDMHDNLINEIPLVALNEFEKLYTTELENLPKTMFKIAITGYDPETHTTIRRTGPPVSTTSLDTVANKAPKVSIFGSPTLKVEFDEPLELKCKVDGYLKPDIEWVNESSGEKLPATVSMVEIPDGFISVLDIDRVDVNTNYQCKATNSIGSDHTTVSVEISTYFNILENPKDTIINYQNEGELHCKVDAYPPATITWYKNSRPLLENDNLEFSDDNSIMKIKEMHLSDDGDYICEMRNKYNRKIKSARITITGIEPPVINSSFTTIAVTSGSDAVIDCNVIQGTPKPTITWYFSSDNYSGENTKELDEWNDQEVFTIHNVDKNKSGTYSCTVKNEAGNAYHEVELTIEYPPEIEEDLNEMRVAEGDSVTMPCYVEGKPDPVVTWYKNNVLLTKSDKIYIYRDHSIGITVGLDDIGNYTCKATNKYGTASRFVKLDVYVPVTITLPKVTKMDVRVGATLNLPCQANGFPKPDTEWTYFSFNSSLPKTIMKFHGASILKLKDMKTEEEGYFTCIAKNSVGSTNASYEIHVLAPPAIDNIYLDKKFKVVEGDLVAMIKCNATGNPPPTIRWLKDGYWVAEGDNLSLDKETVIMKNITEEAAGVYVCEAMNNLGFDRDVYEVIVDKSPQPGHPTSTIITGEGSTTAVRCDVPHKKTDHLRWYKNGVLIQAGELILTNAKVTDSGLYTCRVSNFVRSTSGNTLVKVGMKPKFVSDEEENIEYVESVPRVLNCETTNIPQPQSNNWNEVEQRVRSLAKATSSELVITTGVAEDLTLPDIYKTAKEIFVIDNKSNTQPVPKYLWKVVQDPSTQSSLVIIQVNVPDLLDSETAAYILCRDICNTTEWMKGSSWYDVSRGFTYCCTLKDFQKSFGYNGVFLPYDKVLSDVSMIPGYSLT